MAHLKTSMPHATQPAGKPKPPVPPKPDVSSELSPTSLRVQSTRGTQVNLCRKGQALVKNTNVPTQPSTAPTVRKKEEPIYTEIAGDEAVSPDAVPVSKPLPPPKPPGLLVKPHPVPPVRNGLTSDPKPHSHSPSSTTTTTTSSSSSFHFASSLIRRSRSLTSDLLCWARPPKSPPLGPGPRPPPRALARSVSLGRNQAPPTSEDTRVKSCSLGHGQAPPTSADVRVKSCSLGRNANLLPWPSEKQQWSPPDSSPTRGPPVPPPRSKKKRADTLPIQSQTVNRPNLLRSVSLDARPTVQYRPAGKLASPVTAKLVTPIIIPTKAELARVVSPGTNPSRKLIPQSPTSPTVAHRKTDKCIIASRKKDLPIVASPKINPHIISSPDTRSSADLLTSGVTDSPKKVAPPIPARDSAIAELHSAEPHIVTPKKDLFIVAPAKREKPTKVAPLVPTRRAPPTPVAKAPTTVAPSSTETVLLTDKPIQSTPSEKDAVANTPSTVEATCVITISHSEKNAPKTTPIYAVVNKKRSQPQPMVALLDPTLAMGNAGIVGANSDAKSDSYYSAEEVLDSPSSPVVSQLEDKHEELCKVDGDEETEHLGSEEKTESCDADLDSSVQTEVDSEAKSVVEFGKAEEEDRSKEMEDGQKMLEELQSSQDEAGSITTEHVEETATKKDEIIIEAETATKDEAVTEAETVRKDETVTEAETVRKDETVTEAETVTKDETVTEPEIVIKEEEVGIKQESVLKEYETETGHLDVEHQPDLPQPEDLEDTSRSSDNLESNVQKLEGSIGAIAEMLEGLEQVVEGSGNSSLPQQEIQQEISRLVVGGKVVDTPPSGTPVEEGRTLKAALESSLMLAQPCLMGNGLEKTRGPIRRQTWAGADQRIRKESSTSPVSETSSSSQEMQKGRNVGGGRLWCDEGELSGGFLADDDSTDAPCGDEDATDAPSPIRRKVAAILLGKGGITKKSPRVKQKRFERSSNRASLPIESSKSRFYIAPNLPEPLSAPLAQEEGSLGGASVSSEEEGASTPPESPLQEDPVTKRRRKAFLIAQELASSERVFVDALRLLTQDFKKVVEDSLSLSEVDLARVLGSLPQLQRLNEDLLDDLESRVANWSQLPAVAEVIVRKGPFLKLYADYIRNFEVQCSLLDELRARIPAFARTASEFEASPRCCLLGLKHYMLKPVQRIPQYRLLLQDYLAHLDPDSLDYQHTLAALHVVQDVAAHADNSLKLGDNVERMLDLQRRLGSYELIRPGRTLLKEGELYKLGRKERQPRFFILLSDCLLYTSYSGGHPGGSLRVHSELPLCGMRVSCASQNTDFSQTEFSVISVTRSFSLTCRSSVEREEWVGALQEAIRENACKRWSFASAQLGLSQGSPTSASASAQAAEFRLGKEAPVWIPDARVTMCQLCTAHFTVTFRRHHCRACGKVVCGHCSANRAPLEYRKNEPARVCDYCFDFLYKEFEQRERQSGRSREDLRSHFRRFGVGAGSGGSLGGSSDGSSNRRFIPSRLKEVCANDAGSQMSGWLWWKAGGGGGGGGGKAYKRNWFVLKDRVLYFYGASQDVVALQSLPVLGYLLLHSPYESWGWQEGLDPRLVFQLNHAGQPPLVFQAENAALADKWVSAMKGAIVL